MAGALRKVHWLASYPKSGNTWVRLMLHAYRLGVDTIDLQANNEVTLLDIQRYAYQVVAPINLEDMTPMQHTHLHYAALLHLIARSPYAPTILKTHNANAMVGEVFLVPKSLTDRVVYLVRDPRDVCCSYAKHMNKSHEDTAECMNKEQFRAVDPASTLSHWLNTWSTHVKSWVDDVLVLRYEDVHHDPAQALSQILVHYRLAENPDAARVRKAVEATRFDRLQEQEGQTGFLDAPKNGNVFFRSGKAGAWKDGLDPALARQIEQDHGEVMSKLGYKLQTAEAA